MNPTIASKAIKPRMRANFGGAGPEAQLLSLPIAGRGNWRALQ